MDLEFLGDSSCIAAAGWKSNTLVIHFQDGTVYSYEGVSQWIWVALKRSVSKGYYFNHNIRNAGYNYYQGEPPESVNIDQKFFERILDESVQVTEEEAGLS